MKESKPKIYCSLDIETSDFDPANGEVLEVGMIFFEIQKKGLKLLREWTSTFKPTKEVSPRILALTGITMDELEDSPNFKDKYAEIQELIEDAVIVGHNVTFDTKFLEGYGLKFSGKKIDTLDLAQIFLPTHPSYNLEALMGALEVDHKDAHRALADSRAALVVMERLLGFYASFPKELKKQLKTLFAKDPQSEMNVLLDTEFKSIKIKEKKAVFEVSQSKEITKGIEGSSSIVTFPLGFNYYSYIYGALKKSKEKILLVVPSKKVVYDLWQQEIARPYFENKEVFNETAFNKLLRKNDAETRNFLAKILVWKELNWQKESLNDLNFSFFGSQFKSLINWENKKKQQWEMPSKEHVIAVDYVNFINNDFSALNDRKILVLDINSFEGALTFVTSKKVSWNDFTYTLKQIYDPVTKYGKKEFANLVAEALSQADLFFGLASMHWQKIDNTTQNILVNQNVMNHESYSVIKKAAEGFCNKMFIANEVLKSERVTDYINHLKDFFVVDPGQVRWVEISEGKLTFLTSPIHLEGISKLKLGPFKNILFTASLGTEALIKYFVNRLGLSGFEIKNIGQQELRSKVEVLIHKDTHDSERLLSLIDNLQMPAAVLLPSMGAVKEFYENNFRTLQQKFKVYAQGYSGGTNKILGNFSINENSLLIATDRFILKQPGRKLNVKSLVITRLPFEPFNHPLFVVQAEKYENQFLDFNIPRAVYNFHTVIGFFYSANLQQVHILDQKIHKEYGKYFTDYLKSLPFVEIPS